MLKWSNILYIYSLLFSHFHYRNQEHKSSNSTQHDDKLFTACIQNLLYLKANNISDSEWYRIVEEILGVPHSTQQRWLAKFLRDSDNTDAEVKYPPHQMSASNHHIFIG